jgi:hypothetical protein
LCVDTDCIMSLIDKTYLQKFLSSVKILHTDDFISVRDIEIVIHNCSEYVYLKLFISESFEIAKFSHQAHIVDNLRTKFLMNMNILEFEEIILDISRRKLILSLCENLKIFIRVISKSKFRINRVILVERFISVSAKSMISMSIKMKNSISDRDYIFQSVTRDLNLDSIEEVMTHLINANLVAMQIINFTNKSMIISRKTRLNQLMKYEKHECYVIDATKASLTARSFWRKIATVISIQDDMKKIANNMKEKSSQDIIVYKIADTQQLLFDVIAKFSFLWDKTENFMINIFENQWMSITLKFDARIETTKIYSMKSSERKLIDKTFNKLHEQDKMHWTTKLITHETSIFVIWRMINEKKKNRVIVNIRELNKIVKSNSYSMFLQIDIIWTVAECKFIFVINATTFFYQFRVRKKDKHKLTIVFHREQKYFSIALMRFKNSFAYAQKRIDIILRNIKKFCQAFINDIIILFNILKKQIEHFSKMFQRLLEHDIKLNSCKAFLSFLSVVLLEQHVDDFELHAVKNKIVVILSWKFSVTLKALKIYLEFIEWLSDYVAWYAQKTESLQDRKTLLLKSSSSQKDHVKKVYVSKTILKNSSKKKWKTFEMIQKIFKNSRFFTHFDLIRQFLIDVNVFKEDFEAFAYHLKRENMTKSTVVESIVFLSKTLISTEKRYWSTELKIAVVVWVIKKLHHIIRASRHSIIIWTDHSVIVVIIKQTKMITSNTNKLNLRLIKADMYLFQFHLDVKHKFERNHIDSNVLPRLSSWKNEEKFIIKHENDTLNHINVYVDILVKMFSNFKTRLIVAYKFDREWSSLYFMLKILKISRKLVTRQSIINSNFVKQSNHEKIEFERRDNLIYHLNRSISKVRLCISKSLMQNIFKMTHDDVLHAEFHRAYATINETFYIRRLSHYLRQYIAYCSQCLFNQTKRHRFYDSLYSISTLKISFHTITMNFILVLSSFDWRKYDIMLTITDKFFKTKLLISDLNNWKAKNWITALWKYLQLFN